MSIDVGVGEFTGGCDQAAPAQLVLYMMSVAFRPLLRALTTLGGAGTMGSLARPKPRRRWSRELRLEEGAASVMEERRQTTKKAKKECIVVCCRIVYGITVNGLKWGVKNV